jgi:hypothetical protein
VRCPRLTLVSATLLSLLLSNTYIREENTRDTTPGVNALLVVLFGTTSKTPLVASDRVLVSLDATLQAINGRAQKLVLLSKARGLLLPAKGQVGSRDNFDEVHEVVSLLVGVLVGVVKGVDVVAGPSSGAVVLMLLLHVRDNDLAQLRTKAKMVNLVGKGVRVFVLEVVLEVVHVHVAVGEGLSGSDMEVSDDLVDSNATLETAALLSLLVEVLGIVFALTLLNALSATERP